MGLTGVALTTIATASSEFKLTRKKLNGILATALKKMQAQSEGGQKNNVCPFCTEILKTPTEWHNMWACNSFIPIRVNLADELIIQQHSSDTALKSQWAPRKENIMKQWREDMIKKNIIINRRRRFRR